MVINNDRARRASNQHDGAHLPTVTRFPPVATSAVTEKLRFVGEGVVGERLDGRDAGVRNAHLQITRQVETQVDIMTVGMTVADFYSRENNPRTGAATRLGSARRIPARLGTTRAESPGRWRTPSFPGARRGASFFR